MATAYPAAIDSFVAKQDNVDDVEAVNINDLQEAIEALETKVGVTSSAVSSSHDYKLTDLAAGGVDQAAIGASAVGQGELKTTTVEVSQAAGAQANHTVTGAGSYAFWPQVKETLDTPVSGIKVLGTDTQVGSTYITNVFMNALGASSGSLYARFRYVQASGEVFWLFVLREKDTKKIITSSAAPDHCCFGNGGKPALVPHPFNGVFERDGKQYMPGICFNDEQEREVEIIVINPTKKNIVRMKTEAIESDEDKQDRSFLQVFLEDYEVDDSVEPNWPSEPVTVGLPDDAVVGKKATPIKKVIAQPDMVKTAALKKRQL